MGKFKVGDSVIILQGSGVDQPSWITDMNYHVGKTSVIIQITPGGYYKLKDNIFIWREDWLKLDAIKIGDHVTVRNDLVIGTKYGSCLFVGSMKLSLGKTYTVKSVLEQNAFYLKEVGFIWSGEMLVKSNTKTAFDQGDYVVLQNMQHDPDFVNNHCYKVRDNNKNYLTVVLDSKGVSNGWAVIDFHSNKWRYATEQEKLMYDSKGRPYDVSSLVDGTTGKQSLIIKGPTVNYETVKKEGVYPIQTPLIIKTKRKPKKNKNLIIL